jgi:hypothetical protein
MKTGIEFSCLLVLVMGAKVTSKTLLQRKISIYYYKNPNPKFSFRSIKFCFWILKRYFYYKTVNFLTSDENIERD